MSRLRSVWEQLASRNASTLLQKRVDVCTGEELEAAVVQHTKGRQYILSAAACVSTRTIDLNIPAQSITHLVPGGRWLLFNPPRFECGLRYVDLDDPQPGWRQLIPPLSADALFTSFSLDQSSDAPLSTFHLVVEVYRYLLLHESDQSTMTREMTVWKIVPTFDANGSINGLAAERKSHFRVDQRGIIRDRTVQLQGQYLAFTGVRDSECSIVRWADADGRIDDYPSRTVYHHMCDVRATLSAHPSPFLHLSSLDVS